MNFLDWLRNQNQRFLDPGRNSLDWLCAIRIKIVNNAFIFYEKCIIWSLLVSINFKMVDLWITCLSKKLSYRFQEISDEMFQNAAKTHFCWILQLTIRTYNLLFWGRVCHEAKNVYLSTENIDKCSQDTLYAYVIIIMVGAIITGINYGFFYLTLNPLTGMCIFNKK